MQYSHQLAAADRGPLKAPGLGLDRRPVSADQPPPLPRPRPPLQFEVNAFNTIWELTLAKPYKDGGPAISPTNLQKLVSSVYIDGKVGRAGGLWPGSGQGAGGQIGASL
jgi:hypothetical protein